MSTRSRVSERACTKASTPAPAAASEVLLGGVSGDEAVRMLQSMQNMDHLHDLHMYAPDEDGGLQLVTAHRVVMAAASERLEKTVARRNADFKEGQPGAEIHFDRGEFVGSMDACELRAIVSYSYGDTELRVPHKKLVGVSAAADFVGMDALSELCADKAIEGLQPCNAALTLQQANQRGVQRVREASMKLVLKEFEAVCETEGFIRKLDVDLMCEVIERDELHLEGGEEVVFEAVLRWLGAGIPGRGATEATRVLERVRFPQMDTLYLGTKVAKCDAASVAGLEVLQRLYVEATLYRALLSDGTARVQAALEAGVVARSVRTRTRRGNGLDAGKMECVKMVDTGHDGVVWRVVQVGEWVVTTSADGTFKVWKQDEWTCVKTVDTHQGELCAATECGGMLVTGGDNGSIKLWEQETWTCVRTLEGHRCCVNDLLVHGGWLLTLSVGGEVRVWDRTSWECLRVVPTGHTIEAWSLVVHDGKLYCGGAYGDRSIRVIDITTWASVATMEGHTGTVYQLLVREGKLFSCSDDKTIKAWSTGEGRECEQTLEGHTGSVYSIAVCGDKLVSAMGANGNNSVRVWGLTDGTGRWQCERVLRDYDGGLSSLALATDGRRLFGAGDSTLFVWGEAS